MVKNNYRNECFLNEYLNLYCFSQTNVIHVQKQTWFKQWQKILFEKKVILMKSCFPLKMGIWHSFNQKEKCGCKMRMYRGNVKVITKNNENIRE